MEVYGAPEDLGSGHGSTCSDMIVRYLEDRLALSAQERWSGTDSTRDLIVEIAEGTLPHHESYSEELFAEMTSMAHAAGISPAEAVVVGGFTDLVDVVRTHSGRSVTEDDCTAIINPMSGVLAQTWDMHASAGEFVVMLKLNPLNGPTLVVQTTAGCLGQIGMNEAGIAVGINNLTAWGRPGVTWPFVVRKALQQTTLDDAVEMVLSASLAGGHNFLIMGPDGEGANIEAMPLSQKVTRVTSEPFVHSNHCLVPETQAEQADRLSTSVESSDLRLDLGYKLADDLEAFFSEPAISRRATDPHDIATCGAVIVEPRERRMRAVWGLPGDRPWETFQL